MGKGREISPKKFTYRSYDTPKVIKFIFKNQKESFSPPASPPHKKNCPIHVEGDPDLRPRPFSSPHNPNMRSDLFQVQRSGLKSLTLGHVLDDAITQKPKRTRFGDDIIQ
jgi:hypothetical protein